METAEELNHQPESMTMLPCDLTKIAATIRKGNSKKANSLMNIPIRYYGKVIYMDNQSTAALEALRQGHSLFITGACGSGKTHLAVALMNEWFADKIFLDGDYLKYGQAFFLSAIELYLEIKQSWGDDTGESETRILDKYSRQGLLVIDDLGAEKISDWSRQVLYLLIDRRYRNMQQTIITSNLTHSQIAEHLDDRIASRLCEMGITIDLKNKDWRVKRG